MKNVPSDIAFTPSVKAVQAAKGSRDGYARMESGRGWKTAIDRELAAFIDTLDMFYLSTANAQGQPYVQYRGGPAGFLKVMDEQTLAFADFGGNKQYITLGNLAENGKAFLFLMDYATPQRIKVWGTAKVVEDDERLLNNLRDAAYPGRPERAIVFTVAAWDVNCQQHIHRRFAEADVAAAVGKLQRRVEELEAEVAAMKTR